MGTMNSMSQWPGQEQIDAEIKICLEELKAMGLEANPEEIEAVTEYHQVPNKDAGVENIGVPEDGSGERRPAVGYRIPRKRQANVIVAREALKKRTLGNKRWMQLKCNDGIRDRGLKQQLRLGSKGDVNDRP
jgi:hypothetical protein